MDVLSTTSTGNPSPSVGNMGDVFYGFNQNVNGHNCYIKTTGIDGSTGWMPIGNATNLSSADISAAVTNDPGPPGDKHRPALAYFSAVSSARICQAQSTEYGKKRLLRRREYIVSSPLPYISGEDNSFVGSLKVFDAPQMSGICSVTQAAPSGTTAAEAITNWLSPTNYRASYLVLNSVNLNPEGNHPFFIGNEGTKSCVSRFGIQDPLGFSTYNMPVADTFVRTSGSTLPATLLGTSSDFDSGASDFNGFLFNGILSPNQGVPNGTTFYFVFSDTHASGSYYPCNGNKEISSFIAPLGVPICTWSGGLQTLRNISEMQTTGVLGQGPLGTGSFSLGNPVNETNGLTYIMSVGGTSSHAGRWSYSFSPNSTSNYASHSLLCGIEAE